MARFVVFVVLDIFVGVDCVRFVVRSVGFCFGCLIAGREPPILGIARRFFVLRFGKMFGKSCRFVIGQLRGGVLVERQMRLIFGKRMMLFMAGIMRPSRLFRGEPVKRPSGGEIEFVGVNRVVMIFDFQMFFDSEMLFHFIGMRTGSVCGARFQGRIVHRFGRQMLVRLPF